MSDLNSLYEQYVLKNTVISENADVNVDDNDDSDAAPKKAVGSKKKKSAGKDNIGAITYNDSFNNVFGNLLKEMDEDFGGEGDTVFNYEDSEDGGDVEGSDESFTLSELRNMTLGELVDLLNGEGGEDELDDSFGDEGVEDSFESNEDTVPLESYGFGDGAGNYKGDQGNYDGKAKTQGKSNHVKANGDIDKSKQKTGYTPEDTEGSEGAEHGDQGTYDGKAKTQGKSNLVKANGDMETGKQKTGYKTGSGKKDKNLF